MGISLALFQVDHDNVMALGLPALNHALQTGDLTPLRQVLKGFPFDESEELVDHFQKRVMRLREVGAPSVVIESEERRLASVRSPAVGTIDRASLAQLREMLGGWCQEARTVDLDKAWDLVHWYIDPGRRLRPDGDWRTLPVEVRPSNYDYALYGYEPYSKDAAGEPVIRTRGNPESSWYNPPGVVSGIADVVERVPVEAWEQIDREMEATPAENQPYLSHTVGRLEYARGAFARFSHFYQAAARRGFGVSVEFY